jgi:Tol biopolymer transport system component
MTSHDIPALLSAALHEETEAMTVTDSHQAAGRLEGAMRANRRRRIALVLATAAAAVTVMVVGVGVLVADDDRGAAPAPVSPGPSLPAPGHRIIFDSDADQKIFVVSDRGGPPQPVLEGTLPRFSPDGKRLVFSNKNGVPSVATVGEWQGTPLDDRPLPDGFERVGLTWSPDGTQVAYVEMLDSDFPEGGDLYVVDAASGTAEKVRHFAGPYVKPLEWSPDGSTLLMGFDRSGEGGRMVVDSFDLSSGALTPLLRGWGETLGVRYSPDGSQIAFYSDSRACICVAAPDGTGIRVVLQFSGAEPDSARLAWSPDGSQLVWDERFGGQINLLDVTTGVSTKLTTGGGRAPAIDWDRP